MHSTEMMGLLQSAVISHFQVWKSNEIYTVIEGRLFASVNASINSRHNLMYSGNGCLANLMALIALISLQSGV